MPPPFKQTLLVRQVRFLNCLTPKSFASNFFDDFIKLIGPSTIPEVFKHFLPKIQERRKEEFIELHLPGRKKFVQLFLGPRNLVVSMTEPLDILTTFFHF